MTKAVPWVLRPIAAICADAARLTGCKVGELKGRSRQPDHCLPRLAVVWAARRTTANSHSQIGHVLGGRDHSTMVDAYRRAERRRRIDPQFRQLTDELLQLALERYPHDDARS